jgi:hypothetical protein
VGILEFSGRFTGEEDQHRSQHFSSESADMLHKRINAGDAAGKLAGEHLFHRVELGFDAIGEGFKR